MPIIFLRFVLPFIVIVGLHIYLSLKDNKFWGLLIPFLCVLITIIFAYNALDTLGSITAFFIMLIPNLIAISIYILCRKFKRHRDEEIIRIKFRDKK